MCVQSCRHAVHQHVCRQYHLGTADCYRVEWVIWDNLLNENFKNLMGALDNQQTAKLLVIGV